MTSDQMSLDIEPGFSDLYPRVENLRNGDLLEGHSGKAFPRPLLVLGVQRGTDGQYEIIYRQTRGTEDTYGVLALPAGTPVDLKPPF